MKLGLENKRNVVALSVLGLVALYGIYSNFFDSSSSPSSPVHAPVASAPPAIGSQVAESEAPPPPVRPRKRNEEWHPEVHPKNKEDQVAPDKIDPTLHLELLTKVMASKPAGGARNLFEFGAAPIKSMVPVLQAKNEPIVTGPKPMGPPALPPPPPPPGPAQPPPPPPMAPLNAQYYGFATPTHSGIRRGFFMMPPEVKPQAFGAAPPLPGEGDVILIKREGEMLTRDYRIVKLEAGSVTVEETRDLKRTKVLPMVKDASD